MGCNASDTAAGPQATYPKPGKGQLQVKVPLGTPPGATVEVKTADGQTLRCTVPTGIPAGGVFQLEYDLSTGAPPPPRTSNLPPPGEMKVIHEDKQLTKAVLTSSLPTYWTNRACNEQKSAFDDMVYIDRKMHASFDHLFKETYFQKATRDRPCPKAVGSKCPKTPGGCPCVQPDGDPGLPKGYVVRSVIRVEDSNMWSQYTRKKQEIRSANNSAGRLPLKSVDPPIQTDVVADSHPETFDPLDNDLNEVYLWHGTSVRAALAIAANDFKVDLAGSNTGTMYGRGTYLAECCTKADEYATDESENEYYNQVFALLLCRVVLGRFYYTEKREEEAGTKCKDGGYDSVVGDRLKSAGTFREFVVYSSDAVYPEYVILYNRVHNSDDDRTVEEWRRAHFHMQLPVYWSNLYKNPKEDPFHEQYIVRKQTKVLLERLLQACFVGNRCILKSARRIENSTIWNGYIEFKQRLEREVGGISKSYKPTNLLYGSRETGHILTHQHLKGEEAEQSISIANLEERINESLLWHGTSKAAAEKIAKEDFHIPKGKEMRGAMRFGNGAYFSEALEPALSNCGEPDVSTGGKSYFLLLCRVLCGDIYYTEQHTEIDAGQNRDARHKHSVLANPDGKGPREFVVPLTDQVYPEFILEVEAPNWVAPQREEARKVTVQITVPPGYSGGMKIPIQTPDGREVSVLLPGGTLPGQVVQLEV